MCYFPGNVLTLLHSSFFHFFASLPSELGLLTRLHILQLGNNGFSGMVPATFANLTKLDQVSLQGTDLTGTLDVAFCGESDRDRDYLIADCLNSSSSSSSGPAHPGDVTCSCCTVCCDDGGLCVDV